MAIFTRDMLAWISNVSIFGWRPHSRGYGHYHAKPTRSSGAPTSHPQPSVGVSQNSDTMFPTKAERREIEDYLHKTLAAVGHKRYVTEHVLMGGVIRASPPDIQSLRRNLQLAPRWQHLALLMTSSEGTIDEGLTMGVDLAMELAICLGANRSSFVLPASRSNGSLHTMLHGRRQHVVNTLNDEAEVILRESLARRKMALGKDHEDVAESCYRLGRYLQHQAQRFPDQVRDELAVYHRSRTTMPGD